MLVDVCGPSIKRELPCIGIPLRSLVAVTFPLSESRAAALRRILRRIGAVRGLRDREEVLCCSRLRIDRLAGEAVVTPAAMPLKLLEFWKEAETEAEALEAGVPLVAFPYAAVFR